MQGWRKTMEDDAVYVTNMRAAIHDRRGLSRQSSTNSAGDSHSVGSHHSSGSGHSPRLSNSPVGSISRKLRKSLNARDATQADAFKLAESTGPSPYNDMFLSVFDGHGGSQVSQFVAKEIAAEFAKEEYMQRFNPGAQAVTSTTEEGDQENSDTDVGAVGLPAGSAAAAATDEEKAKKEEVNAVNESEVRTDSDLSDTELILQGVTAAYLRTDKRLLEATLSSNPGYRPKQFDEMGSTAVTAYINETDICVAWLGDSRAVLCKGGRAVPLTSDHKPSVPGEMERITKAGGIVTRGRVNGSLAVSRSFGDFFYKTPPDVPPAEQMVSAAPETVSIARDEESDEFLILACDGVWDAITNQDACYLISELAAQKIPIEKICQKFLDYCLIANSRDNMTIVLVLFPASKRLEPKAYLNAEGFQDAIAPKDDLTIVNSHASKPAMRGSMQATRRASITLFNELKKSDGQIKISTAAATHADEVLTLTKEVVNSWTEDDVVERFLKPLELDEYVDVFREEGVDGKLLLELTQLECEDDLMMNPLDARFLKMATTFVGQKQ
jgi:serine/threonine protein phosphatase PrpC